MATFAGNVAPTNDTDANFRLWISFVHNSITTVGGWIRTADTGQIDFATVTTTAAANTKAGYVVYRMDDALQATNPVYLKIGFGSGGAAQTPGLWFAIGSGTDGAGNFIDANDANRAALYFDQFSRSTPAIACAGSVTSTRVSFGSVSTDRFVLFLFESTGPTITKSPPSGTADCSNIGPNDCTSEHLGVNDALGEPANYAVLFSIERARDWNGATLGSHLVVAWSATNARLAHHTYVSLDHSLPLLGAISGMIYVLGDEPNTDFAIIRESATPSANAPATSLVPFKRNIYPSPPGINVMVSRYSRFRIDSPGACINNCPSKTYTTGRTVELSPYGVARTYRTCAGIRTGNFVGSGQDPVGFVHVLYE